MRRRRDKGINIQLKDNWFKNAVNVEMTMKRRITEKMKDNTVFVQKGVSLLKKVELPKDAKDKFTATIL